MDEVQPVVTVLNTRPQHQAQPLTNLLVNAGFNSLSCPTLAIEGVSLSEVPTPCLADFQRIFFISVNSVNQLENQWQLLYNQALTIPKTIKVYAIGKATRTALIAKGIEVTTLAKAYDTDALLSSLETDLAGVRCLIVKGENGLKALADGLADKGANVTEWQCYRRVRAPFCEQTWQLFRQSKHPIVLASSLESWQSLVANVTENAGRTEQKWLLQQDCIAFSERVEQAILESGWLGRIRVVPEQSNQGIVDSVRQFAAVLTD